MNKELNIGDYVKTKQGRIGKISNLTVDYSSELILCEESSIPFSKHQIIKSSPNIIDLIEVGDLIKLKLTKQIQQVLSKNENEIDLTDYVFYDLKEASFTDEIEWVITHEQLEQMKYEVNK